MTIEIETATATIETTPAGVNLTTQPQVGDVLESSWGYEQTNVDFYQVTAVTKASVRIRKIGKTTLPGDAGRSTNQVIPVRDRFVGAEMTKRFRPAYDKGYRCKIEDYASASSWDGKPAYETAAGFGH